MNVPTLNSAIPFAILRKLGLIRQRKLVVHVASAIVATMAVLLAAMGVAMLIDWLATLYEPRWRIVLTLAALAAAGLTAAGWLIIASRRVLSWSRVASDVDRELPQLEERWTTMTQLRPADATNPQLVHPAMLRHVATEANRWEPHVEPEQIVSLSALLRTMIGLTVVTLVLAVAVVLDWRQTWVLMQRFWLPGSAISATELIRLPGDVVVGRKEPLVLDARLRGKPVEQATLFLRNGENQSRTVSLVAHGRDPIEFSHRVRSVAEPFSYRFRAGDGQTAWYTVAVADRPEIDNLEMTVTPPAYTRHEPKTIHELPPRLSAMERSEMTVALRPDVPVVRVVLRLGNGKDVQLAADKDGWYRWQTTLTEGLELTPILTESHGLTNRRPAKCEISVYPDNPPAVKVLSPDDEIEVRPDDTIQISFSATDDVGIGEAELLVYDDALAADGVEPQPLAAIPIPLGDQSGAPSVQQKVDLDLAKLGFVDGSQFSYEIRVREDRGGASQTPAGPMDANLIAQRAPAPGANSPNGSTQPPPANSMQPSAASPAAAQGEREGTSSTPDAAATQKESTAASTPSPGESATPPTPQRTNPSTKAAPSTEVASNEPNESTEEESTTSAPTSPQTNQVAGTQSANSTNKASTARNATGQTGSAAKSQPSQSPKAEQPPMAKDEGKGGAEQAESNPTGDETPKPAPESQEAGPARVATTARRALGGAKKQPGAGEPQPSGQNSQSPRASQTASSGEPSSPSEPAPGDSMPRRGLDVPQSAASQRMQIKVDQWAGSFTGQQRAMAEIAIAPALGALDQVLAKAARTAGGVLDDVAASGRWGGRHDRDVTSAEKQTDEAQQIIVRVERDSKDTPYAFIGLQLVDVGLAHINPAKQGFWKALESEGDDRIGSVRDARQHLGQARKLLAELRGQFERSKKEFQLAESVEQVKKMYRVFVENAQALLETQENDPTRYGRKMAEFELDDEYLARLQEVLKMRQELQAELARILAEDPRLLRRFMDAMRRRAGNLREQLADVVAGQQDLNREVRAWTLVEEADRPRIAKILMLRQLQDAGKIAAASGELQSRYQAWLPLDRDSTDADLTAATEKIQRVATASGELAAAAQKLTAEAQRPVPAEPQATDEEVRQASDETASAPQPTGLNSVIACAERAYEESKQLEVALRQLAARDKDADAAGFAATRLVEARGLIADTSAFVRQMRAHDAGTYPRAAEVDQYRLAMKTDELAGKLGTIEQNLAGMMQRTDGSLPEPMARKARDFLTTLDKQVSPNQLAGVYALHSAQLPRAVERQRAAGDALTRAEKQFDELMRMAIEEMDKLPVQDPIADLLDDPTLDELLAQLEQESAMLESLGIPGRPSNLQIIGDWLRPGSGSGGSGGAAGMVMNQLRNEEGVPNAG